MHISVQRGYSQNELKSKISDYLSGGPIINEQPEQVQESTPRCPKCGSEMVLRTAQQGTHKGENFWGCPKFPTCNGTIFINAR
jgi:predicted RNA-binding Zn-ribbon protein involved in translation (DUF1610 family)